MNDESYTDPILSQIFLPTIEFNVHLISKLTFGRLQYHEKQCFPRTWTINKQATKHVKKHKYLHLIKSGYVLDSYR
jgi:hypothetical protein